MQGRATAVAVSLRCGGATKQLYPGDTSHSMRFSKQTPGYQQKWVRTKHRRDDREQLIFHRHDPQPRNVIMAGKCGLVFFCLNSKDKARAPAEHGTRELCFNFAAELKPAFNTN